MATPDFDNLTHGPAIFQLADTEIGHTHGGISCTITPQNRAQNVDQFGSSECNIIHTGDEVRMNVPFAEWTADTLAEVYEPGNNQTATSSADYLGIGRSSGYIYTTQDAKIVPRLTADAAKRIQMWRATPIGDFELMHNSDDDRIFEVEFACLVDESQTDGELIGKLQITTS